MIFHPPLSQACILIDNLKCQILQNYMIWSITTEQKDEPSKFISLLVKNIWELQNSFHVDFRELEFLHKSMNLVTNRQLTNYLHILIQQNASTWFVTYDWTVEPLEGRAGYSSWLNVGGIEHFEMHMSSWGIIHLIRTHLEFHRIYRHMYGHTSEVSCSHFNFGCSKYF